MHVEIRHDGEEAVAEKALLAEELRAGRQPAQLVRPGPGAGAADRVEHRERADPRHCAQLPLGGFDARQAARRPRVVRFEEEQHRRRIGKEALEGAGRGEVGIAGDDEPVEPALRRNARRADGRQRNEQRVRHQDGDAPGDDARQHPGREVVHRWNPTAPSRREAR